MIERKYLFHFIDSSFDDWTDGNGELITDGTPPSNATYVRLGKYLEQYQEELNPQTSVFNNILGEQMVLHNGYQVSSSVEPYYAEEGDALWGKLQEIANKRITGNGCLTTRIDGLMNESGEVQWAYIEQVKVIPQSLGGNTTGVQIPFQVLNCGNRHEINFNVATKTASKKVS